MGNVNNLTQPGGLDPATSKLPRTVEDAMHLTSLLGYEYLWVDAFCIDQADTEDLRRNISTMDAVYALDTLTIYAADGDSNSGIRGLTQGSQNFQQATVRYSDDVQLMVARPAEYFVERSRWNTRAWTFQERICSRRGLIFFDYRFFFQGRQSVMYGEITMEKCALLEE